MFTLIKDSLLLTKKPLWERKKNLQRHSQSTRPIFSLALSLCLQISIPTYIHTFLVLSPICHRNNNLNVQSLNTRNKNLWIAGDLRICRITDEKKTLLNVCVHSVELHTHTHCSMSTLLSLSTTYRYTCTGKNQNVTIRYTCTRASWLSIKHNIPQITDRGLVNIELRPCLLMCCEWS